MNYENVERSPHSEGNFYNCPPLFKIKNPRIILYTYIIRDKETDVDYTLCLESPSNERVVYIYLLMSEKLYNEQSGTINNDIKRGKLFRLKKGKWAYYIYGLTRDGIRITSKVNDIMLELNSLDGCTSYLQTFEGIRYLDLYGIAKVYRNIIERIELHSRYSPEGDYI